MNWTELPQTADDSAARSRALRRFGLLMAAALAVVGALLTWRGRGGAPYVWTVGVALLSLALIRPAWLDPIERMWLKFGEVLGAIMTRVILTAAFMFVITPLAVIRRLVGGDSLGLRPDPHAASYWVPVENNGPATRPDKPY